MVSKDDKNFLAGAAVFVLVAVAMVIAGFELLPSIAAGFAAGLSAAFAFDRMERG
ncbi:MAG: hypothetical protein HYX24_02500 [Candidatus Aenigmarchaeota archaeon]|nr:hypothetical protein [Candidatus Aenigmarchaeota archaeon]